MPRTKMTTRISALLAACALVFTFLSPPPSCADSKLRIMTATTDLAALAQEIGGDRGPVESLAPGYQDPPFEVRRAHVLTPGTGTRRVPSSAWKKKHRAPVSIQLL